MVLIWIIWEHVWGFFFWVKTVTRCQIQYDLALGNCQLSMIGTDHKTCQSLLLLSPSLLLMTIFNDRCKYFSWFDNVFHIFTLFDVSYMSFMFLLLFFLFPSWELPGTDNANKSLLWMFCLVKRRLHKIDKIQIDWIEWRETKWRLNYMFSS